MKRLLLLLGLLPTFSFASGIYNPGSSGGGGGGGASGQVNTGTTYQTPYYSLAGSSNVLSATSNVQVFPSSVTITTGVFTTAIKSTATVDQIIYAGANGYYNGNSSFSYLAPLGGVTGVENVLIRGVNPFVIQQSSNAMGFEWLDNYNTYANANMWGALIIHPNAFPSIAQGNMNPYMRDGSFIAFDTTGQGTNDKGFFAYRVAHPADEATPRTVFMGNTTGQFLINNMYQDCSSGSGLDQSCKMDNSLMFLTSATTRGAQPCPPMTTTQRNAIGTPYNGLCVYDVTVSSYSIYSKPAGVWYYLSTGGGAAASAGGTDKQVQYNSVGSFAGISDFIVAASSLVIGSPTHYISLKSSAGINSSAAAPRSLLEVDVQTTDTSQPFAIFNTGFDSHTAIVVANQGNTVGAKFGIQYLGYNATPNAYSIGGLFGNMTTAAGNVQGDFSFDTRKNTSDTSLTEVVRITSQGVMQISSNTIIPGTTFYQDGSIFHSGLTASLPVQTNADKKLVSLAVDGSGSQFTGTIAAARMPALTGDVTTSAGAVATTAAALQNNIKTFSSTITISNTGGFKTTGPIIGTTFTFISGGSYASQVTSNTILTNTTFYQDGTVIMGATTAVPQAADFRLLVSSANNTTIFGFTQGTHLISSGTYVPVLSSCGTSPTIVGTDFAGTITGGSTSGGCTITFATAFVNDPVCVVTPQTGSVVNTFSYTHSSTAITITETAFGTAKADYVCIGNKG